MRRLNRFPRPALVFVLAATLTLAGCNQHGDAPLGPAALAAVTPAAGPAREGIARAVDAFFTQAPLAETRALLVLKDGRIIAERYGDGYGPQTRLVSWSMAKTITGLMIGMLVADGRLRLDAPVPIPAWQRTGDPRGVITLRQLLQMRSGLKHLEAGDPVYRSDEVRMLFLDGRDDMAAYAEAQPLVTAPGTKFVYSSNTAVILADLAARALAPGGTPRQRRDAVRGYLQDRLFVPAGMTSMVPEFDAAGTLIGGSLIHGTARDWAKFGEVLRNGGAANGVPLVPRSWVTFMTTPSPANPGYGAQTWLNRGAADKRMYPGASAQAFSANGHLGQFIFVSPAQGLTIVRLGRTDEGKLDPVKAGIARLARVFPSR
ncbi:serine hydrolase domain-containing protein [Parablastomonas sp. CN1-191]|uniref:serine hydrolase domain-containing protein n=1 Tax=Parablastomonas sp. CN1-191 TaxID=3400908 RepID=UPI003BF8C838